MDTDPELEVHVAEDEIIAVQPGCDLLQTRRIAATAGKEHCEKG
jgi:hypothetical protein